MIIEAVAPIAMDCSGTWAMIIEAEGSPSSDVTLHV